MPCNLAVTITKAAVLPEHLLKLLTPEIVKSLVESYISQREDLDQKTPRASIRRQDGEVHLPILGYDCFLHVQNGKVRMSRVREWRYNEANQLAEDITTLLSRAADKLFAQQVKTALAKRFGQVQQTTATVDDQGQTQKVTLLTFEVGG